MPVCRRPTDENNIAQDFFIIGERFLVPRQRGKDIAVLIERVDMPRRQRGCARVNFLAPRQGGLNISQRQAAVIKDGSIGWPHLQRLFEGL